MLLQVLQLSSLHFCILVHDLLFHAFPDTQSNLKRTKIYIFWRKTASCRHNRWCEFHYKQSPLKRKLLVPGRKFWLLFPLSSFSSGYICPITSPRQTGMLGCHGSCFYKKPQCKLSHRPSWFCQIVENYPWFCDHCYANSSYWWNFLWSKTPLCWDWKPHQQFVWILTCRT